MKTSEFIYRLKCTRLENESEIINDLFSKQTLLDKELIDISPSILVQALETISKGVTDIELQTHKATKYGWTTKL